MYIFVSVTVIFASVWNLYESCEELYITTSYPLSTFSKEREIEKYVKPEEPEEPEPQPEETPVQGIQLVGLKS